MGHELATVTRAAKQVTHRGDRIVGHDHHRCGRGARTAPRDSRARREGQVITGESSVMTESDRATWH